MALLQAMWAVLLELAPWLLLGAAVAGALHVLLPPASCDATSAGAAAW